MGRKQFPESGVRMAEEAFWAEVVIIRKRTQPLANHVQQREGGGNKQISAQPSSSFHLQISAGVRHCSNSTGRKKTVPDALYALGHRTVERSMEKALERQMQITQYTRSGCYQLYTIMSRYFSKWLSQFYSHWHI